MDQGANLAQEWWPRPNEVTVGHITNLITSASKIYLFSITSLADSVTHIRLCRMQAKPLFSTCVFISVGGVFRKVRNKRIAFPQSNYYDWLDSYHPSPHSSTHVLRATRLRRPARFFLVSAGTANVTPNCPVVDRTDKHKLSRRPPASVDTRAEWIDFPNVPSAVVLQS